MLSIQQTIDKIKWNQEKLKAQESLYEFYKQCWHVIEGVKPFIGGWHIEAICEHLEAVIYGAIPKIGFNVPPRTGKSNLISVVLVAWAWIIDPSLKFVYTSHSLKISLDSSRLCRQLIESPWYQNRWGEVFQLSKDQATKGHFSNSEAGHRIATSVTAGTTGLGGSILIMDDPNNAKDGESEVTRNSTNDYASRTWPSRVNPGSIASHILVQQRLHEDDVSGYTISRDENKEYVWVILPMEFESDRRCETVRLPSTKGKKWKDPRTKEGELLWPEGISEKDVRSRKLELGTYNYAGQYQQRPAPAAGGMIKAENFRIWKNQVPPSIKMVIESWDTALTEKKSGCYSALTAWGVFEHKGADNLILLSVWRDKVEFPELLERARRLCKDYRDTGDKPLKSDHSHSPDMILVEDMSSGSPLIQMLMRSGITVTKFNPKKYGDKEERVKLITHLLEAGRVWLPALPPDFTKLRSFAQDLLDECILFPKGKNRDLVDTMTQVLIRMNVSGVLTHPKDPEPEFDEGRSRGFYWG